LLHGEAIAAGMILESYLSMRLGLIDEQEYTETKSTVKNLFGTLNFTAEDKLTIMELLIHDKKNEYGKVQIAPLKTIGAIKINQSVDDASIAAHLVASICNYNLMIKQRTRLVLFSAAEPMNNTSAASLTIKGHIYPRRSFDESMRLLLAVKGLMDFD